MENTKIDVIINVYGKPWQTIVTLKTLLLYSSEHIDKIYFIQESKQPEVLDFNFIKQTIGYDDIIQFIPPNYCFTPRIGQIGDLSIPENRYVLRYQYGIENSDKKYVFITHNDILYTDDIIGDMLKNIGDSSGIGLIGQCWNCPCSKAGECSPETFSEYNPTYEHVLNLCKKHQPARGFQFTCSIDKQKPMPLPECRLNEFACLIDRDITIKENAYFGDYTGIDLASYWFKFLCDKGYSFKNYYIDKTSKHAYFSSVNNGNSAMFDKHLYRTEEEKAKEYFYDVFK